MSSHFYFNGHRFIGNVGSSMWSMWGQTLNYELYFSHSKINEIISAGKSLKNDLSPPGFHFFTMVQNNWNYKDKWLFLRDL